MEDKGSDIVVRYMRGDGEEGAYVNQKRRVRKRRREVVGGSGPFREAGEPPWLPLY